MILLPSENLSNFYQCSCGVARLMQCPDGLEFRPALNLCDYPENAECTCEYF